MPSDDGERLLRSSDGTRYVVLDAPRTVAPDTRLVRVRTGDDDDAWLLELPAGLVSDTLRGREQRVRGHPHVVATRAIGVVVDRDAAFGAPYRGALHGHDGRPYALLPATRHASLAPALARARGGRAHPPEVVVALAVHCARALTASLEDMALTPHAIAIGDDGVARLRGPLLGALAAREADASEAPRWLHYLAPESVRVGAVAPTPAARAFALGIMLYELAAGRPLLSAGGGAAQELAGWEMTVARTAALPPGTSSELRSVLWTLLQRDPSRRATAQRVIELLEPFAVPIPLHEALALDATGLALFGP